MQAKRRRSARSAANDSDDGDDNNNSVDNKDNDSDAVPTNQTDTDDTDNASPSPDEPATTDDAAATDEPAAVTTSPDYSSLAVAEEPYTYSSDFVDVSIVTPRLTGLEDETIQNEINAVFSDYARYAQSDVAPYETNSQQEHGEGYAVAPYAIDVSFEVQYLKGGLLSITLADYRYLGGAHGETTLIALTFNLKTGDQLSLGDLMRDSSDYEGLINAIIRDEIDRRVTDGQVYELTPFEDIGNTSQWFLTDESLVLYFQQYEYFPYAAGIQNFEVSYQQLEGYLNDYYAAHLIESAI